MARTPSTLVALLAGAGWLVASSVLQAQTYSVLGSFGSPGGRAPYGRLVEGSDGSLYGTTSGGGGASDAGSIFKIDPDGTRFTTLHSFSRSDGLEPHGGLIQAADGNLYGTTAFGGTGSCSYGCGTIFKLDTNGTTFTTLRNFSGSDGSYVLAGLIQAADGYLYGTTALGGAGGYGTVFKIDTNGAALTTLHSFANSEQPNTALIQGTDGNLYGTTQLGFPNDQFGTVFKMATDGTAFATVHSFVLSDGAHPNGLIQAADSKIYGTTSDGGANGYGTIFRTDTSGTTFTTLHSFSSADGGNGAGIVQAANGNLYGATYLGGTNNYGTVFKMDINGTTLTTLYNFAHASDGAYPVGGVMQAEDGNLYGTTSYGGSSCGTDGCGTIFEIDTNGTTLTTLHRFGPGIEGTTPYAGVIQAADGDLYGTTVYGGASGLGTVFKVGTDGATRITLHDFSGSDGANPIAGLNQAADGNLYGTTQNGGANGYGTIFKIDTDGTALTTLHTFSGSDGAFPWGRIVQAADGNLYGTTSSGGVAPGYGTIFKIATNGNAFTTLHVFSNSDGAVPLAGLIQGADGSLYGTTSSVGASGYGTIFKIGASGGALTTLHSFVSSDGAQPYAGLIQAADGNLYGTTARGGTSNLGTVFRVAADGSAFSTMHNFVNGDGVHPYAGLVQAADGNLYGTTFERGAHNYGTIFRIDTSSTTFTKLHVFSEGDGANPYANLVQAGDGNLYGTTGYGGALGYGALFKIVPCVLGQSPIVSATGCLPPGAPGQIASVSGSPADLYYWTVFGGTITGGQGTQTITFTSGIPGSRLSVQVFETDSNGCVGATAETVQVDFNDVPSADPFQPYVCIVGREGITAGCGGGNYCRNNPVTRAQMAVFLLKAEHGSSYQPAPCAGVFGDVACPGTFADWIEQLAAEDVTAGCGGGFYCPDSPVTRRQMAVFLLKAKEGSSYTPPPATGIFGDVPQEDNFAPWIEELYSRQITGGCQATPLLYCPDSPNTRGQMAVFLVKTFGLAD